MPAATREPAWRWLLTVARIRGIDELSGLSHFDEVMSACAAAEPSLAGIVEAAPDHNYRSHGVKIPRQTQRYSGRTAMRADVSVHEPKQPVDDETALAYTMEGLNRDEPGALLPYVWSPGWNSNQSLHKFQAEVGGPIRGGSAGVRLLGAAATAALPDASVPVSGDSAAGFTLVARPRIFGSDELSALSPGVSDMLRPATLELTPTAATQLGVVDGDGLVVGTVAGDDLATLELRINPMLAEGCAGFPTGVDGCHALHPLLRVHLRKAENWQRPPSAAQIISSDRGQHG
jgi:NADH-quinone oxidoreductase subunit G